MQVKVAFCRESVKQNTMEFQLAAAYKDILVDKVLDGILVLLNGSNDVVQAI